MAPRKQGINAKDTDIVPGETVVGLFNDQPSAERGIQALKSAGFSEQQIGVAVRDRQQQQELTENTGTQAAEGAATGAVGGGVLGGVVGLLAGVGALAIPGIGPIIAGGALASTLAGAGIGAAAGGLLGALAGMGIPEEDAQHFERGFQQGGVLVTVQAGTDVETARQALLASGADLGPARQKVSGAGMATASEGTDTIQLREEQLDIEKERVQTGEVRLRKEVVTEQRNIEVPVTREEVVIERHAAGGVPADGTIREGEEIRIPLMEEEVRVEKTPVVREEVSVRKRQVQGTEQVSETVRHEEALIESQGDVSMREDRGMVSESWRGNERRYTDDVNYAGPERRMAGR
ncbi:MAG TPA: YsnF/AvaK domain-containing protein [Gemmatimonadales bacterium]|nr:YsnF/AvaK domain-containing protein [Gemmatimonadales bacterium]